MIGHRQHLHLAGRDLRPDDGVGGHVDLDDAGGEIVGRAGRILVRHLFHLQADRVQETGEDEVGEAGRGRPVELARLLLRQRHQVLQRIEVERGRHRHGDHGAGDARDGDHVLRIIGQLVVEVGMGGERAHRRHQQSVIVVRAEETGDGDDAVAAGAVLDDDRLVPHRRELVGEQAGADVDAAAGPERDDEMHRSRRPGVGGEAGLCRQTGDGERGCEQQGAAARNESCHEILPSRSGFLV